jgi:hypothetical protein
VLRKDPSNIDPYAEGPSSDNQWVVEGRHPMVTVPDVTDAQMQCRTRPIVGNSTILPLTRQSSSA